MEIFFSCPIIKIRDPKNLAVILANKTKLLKTFITEHCELKKDTHFKRKIKGIFNLFRNGLIKDITFDEFIDVYSQALTYGLFMCKLNTESRIDKKTAFLNLPKYLGLVKEIFEILHLDTIPDNISWIVDDIIDVLNNIDIQALVHKLSYSNGVVKEDPYIYFYEHFLSHYDKKKKIQKAVYYTPIPIVQFITKSIRTILRTDFKKTGFEDDDVTALDFACGTGTFLLQIYKEVLENIDEDLKRKYIREKILKDFYGFEYLIAPYVIAHLKLTQYLKEQKFIFQENERIGVYLTDTLDNSDYYNDDLLFPYISEEGKKASEIKKKEPILIVTGNPPYNDYSRNKQQFILELIKDYKEGLNEKKTHLDADYIKFIRYAQWKIEREGQGIVGIVTNNSYIDGVANRIMRKSILETFDKIYILNLHGNKDRQEEDENVFNIKKVGIAIGIFIKNGKSKSQNEKKTFYYSTADNKIITRKSKYKFLLENDITTIKWKKIMPSKPNYWFIDKYDDNITKKGWALTEIFKKYNSGIIGSRNDFVLHFDKEKLMYIIRDLIDLNEKELRTKYKLKDSRDWKLQNVKNGIMRDLENLLGRGAIKNSTDLNDDDWNKIEKYRIKKIHHKILDFRYTYYYDQYGGFLLCPRYEIMENLIDKENIALISVRQVAEGKEFTHCFITNEIPSSRITVSNRGGAFVFPLYLYKKAKRNSNNILAKEINFKDSFIKFITNTYSTVPNEKDILAYIYAILNSKVYRKKYHLLLRRDYPYIPFVENKEIFNEIAQYGEKLISLHTLKCNFIETKQYSFKGKGDYKVKKYKYNDSKVFINKDQFFENIRKDIWNFEIGGYKVLEKYLQERKGKELDLFEINHFIKIARIIEETIKVVNKIDSIIKLLDI